MFPVPATRLSRNSIEHRTTARYKKATHPTVPHTTPHHTTHTNMSHTLTNLTTQPTSAYLATLHAFASALEVLVASMTSQMHSDEYSFGPADRALLLSNLESAKKSAASIAVFKQANALLGTLTDAQRRTLDGIMRGVEALLEEMEVAVEELEVISEGW